MPAARGPGEGLGERVRVEAKVQEPGSGDLNLPAKVGDVEFGDDIFGELARVQFARLGQGHQGVGLVIAEFGVGTGPDENGCGGGVRHNFADGGL